MCLILFLFSVRGDQYPHITQLAAKEISSGSSFNRYIIPKIPISPSAERVTKMTVADESSMMVNGISVEAVSIQSVVSDFTTKFNNVVLVAHNGRRFDFPVLILAALGCGTFDTFAKTITGFADSLTIFKATYPKESYYKQEDLVRNLLHKGYAAHNAIDDVVCLAELLIFVLQSVDNSSLLGKSFTPLDVKHSILFNKEKKNLPSLSVLVSSSVMEISTAENIASSGLIYDHLYMIYKRIGEDGLLNVYTMKKL